MSQNAPNRNRTRWFKAVLLIAIAALFGFNAWVSWISNTDKYWSVNSKPQYVDQLRNLKPINLFQFFADAAGYRDYGPPGQFVRYFVWLFSILAVVALFFARRLFENQASVKSQTIRQQKNVDASSGGTFLELPALPTKKENQQASCPSCGRRTSIGSQFSGLIRCGCGIDVKVEDGVVSRTEPVQKLIPSTAPSGIGNPNQKNVTNVSNVHLGKLENFFPKRAEELRAHARNGGNLSGPIEKVAEGIWSLSQLWLVFLDGDDFGLTDDRAIYDQIVSLANTHPRCSIEHEAGIWMRMVAASLSNFEIAIALGCSVDSVGSILMLNGNYDDTYRMLIGSRMDPTLR